MNTKRREDFPLVGQVLVAGLDLPWSAECEKGLLAGVMADDTGAAVSLAQQVGVRASSFYSPVNVVIWRAIERLVEAREILTLASVAVDLETRGELEGVGGGTGLVQAAGDLITSAHVRHFAEELVLLWQRRRAIHLAGKLREQSFNFKDREGFISRCDDLGRRLVGLGRKAETRTFGERIDAVLADVDARFEGKEDRSNWVYTGMETFDKKLRPLNSAREDQLTIVAGGSGEGKSALMRQWASSALEQRLRVVMFTRETTVDGCIEQMAGTATEFDLMNPDRMLRETRDKFRSYCLRMRDEWAGKLLHCYEHSTNQPLLTIEDLAARVRHHVFTFGPPHLFIVDYLQLFSTEKRMQSREQEVAHVSHVLQALAREMGGAWLVGCQLNEKGLSEMRTIKRERGADGKEGKVIHRLPNAGDLRESQAVFHDADRVLAIYRPPVDSRDSDQTSPNIEKPEQWICQIKRRRGRTGTVKCRFEKPYTRFVEISVPGHQPGQPAAFNKRQFLDEQGDKP